MLHYLFETVRKVANLVIWWAFSAKNAWKAPSILEFYNEDFSKPSRAGEVRADGFGKHGTRTQCTASTAGAKFAHAAGL
ncbi:MAG: hypothetical protein AN488_20715 [Anabaena sp. WA113]|nr:MAG: hypothetical protein AN488_20715 [Anabaena sp. WA113]